LISAFFRSWQNLSNSRSDFKCWRLTSYNATTLSRPHRPPGRDPYRNRPAILAAIMSSSVSAHHSRSTPISFIPSGETVRVLLDASLSC
jgi:hypothetical protein